MSPKFAPASLRCYTAGLLLVLILGLSGCAHTYNVRVDALSNPNVRAGASYRIVPRDAVRADFEPQFAHAVELVESALAARGLFPAESLRDAEMVIELDFGIGSRRKQVTEDVDLFGAASPARAASTRSPASSAASNLTAPQQIPEAPPPPPLTRVTVVTLYEKFLSLSARETPFATKGLRKPVELWRVTVAVEDAKETVDECLPVLVVTATDRLGTTTDARTNVRVSGKSPLAELATNDL